MPRTRPLLDGVLEIDDFAHVERPQELLQHRQVRVELLEPVEVMIAALFVAHQEVHLAQQVIAILDDVLVVFLGRNLQSLLAVLLGLFQLLELHVGEAQVLVALDQAPGVAVGERDLERLEDDGDSLAVALLEQAAVPQVFLDVVDRVRGAEVSLLAERQGEAVLRHRVVQVAHVHVDVGDEVVAGRLPGVVVDGLAGPEGALGIHERLVEAPLAAQGAGQVRRGDKDDVRVGALEQDLAQTLLGLLDLPLGEACRREVAQRPVDEVLIVQLTGDLQGPLELLLGLAKLAAPHLQRAFGGQLRVMRHAIRGHGRLLNCPS